MRTPKIIKLEASYLKLSEGYYHFYGDNGIQFTTIITPESILQNPDWLIPYYYKAIFQEDLFHLLDETT